MWSELHLNQEQDRAPMVGAEVDIKSLPPSGEDIIGHGSERGSGEEIIDDGSASGRDNQNVKGSRRQYHLQAIAEIEEFCSQYKAEEITISSNLRKSLPPAVEALLLRLEGSSTDDTVRELNREDLRGPGFGTLFGGSKDPDFTDKFGQMPKEWAAGVRLLTMTAAGTCKTLEVVKLRGLKLTLQELKAVLEPLQSSSLLRELDIAWNAIVGRNEGCKVVADFLKVNRSVRVLGIGDGQYIRHYLVAYGHPTLEVLSLSGDGWEKEDLAAIIQACPNLQRMPWPEWKVEDEQTAKMYAQILLEHQSFCHLRVEGPAGPVSSLLLSACTGARSATSLTGLQVSLTPSDYSLPRNVLQPVFQTNRNLEDICFREVCTVSEEWRGVFRSLKEGGVLKHLTLVHTRFDEDEGFNFRAWEEMVALVQEGSKLESLYIWKGGEYQHDLCGLIDAVTSNKRMVKFTLTNFKISLDESRALVSLIQKNTSLTSLRFRDLNALNWEEIFSSLRYNATLKELRIYKISRLDDRSLKALLAALQINSALKVIDCNDTNWVREGKDEIVKYALQEKERQEAVTYAFVSTCTTDKPEAIRSLQHIAILRHLYLSFMALDSKDEFDARALEALEALVGESCTLQSLTVFRKERKRFEHKLQRLFQVITSNKSMRSLTLRNLDISLDESEALARVIKDNTSLTRLTFVEVRGAHWEKFFSSLRYNVALETLELCEIQTLDDGAFRQLLAALQVNSSLKKIDIRRTNWPEEGKDAIIREALEQKRRRDNYLAIMTAALGQDEGSVRNSGRLFLCGSACAGKTQLRVALTQVASLHPNSRGSVRSCVEGLYKLRRTEGIEIELLNIDSLQLAVWDLAGQDIFRALQDVLFPKLNLACVFLLLFSPFDKESKKLKPALSEKLHREVIPWLRFISSNSQVTSYFVSNSQTTGYILPQVKIIISHRDKLDMVLRSRLWAEDVINSLRLQFAEILDIDKRVFCTNSRGLGEDVQDVLKCTVECFTHLFTNKLFKVPPTCLTLASVLDTRGRSQSRARSHLHKQVFTCPTPCLSLGTVLSRSGSKAKFEPILPTSEFFEFCRREVVSLTNVNCSAEERRKLMYTVAEYLHDAGNIIQFVKSDLVVVDPNWFTYSFMGRLIGAGHNFERPLVCVDNFKHQKDCHLSNAAFKGLLREFAQILSDEGYSTVDENILEMLMKEMDLCFADPQASGYFAPVIFAAEKHKSSSEGLRKLPDWRCVAEKSKMGLVINYVGVRVQCRDQLRTILTPSFFPRFQVHFRNLLISQHLREDQIVCDYNMIYIVWEGYEIYVESDGNVGDHIDVLVRSSDSRSQTFKFIYRKVVKEMQDFCASSKGCPGVALVLNVLRTDCVQNLTLSAYRDEHQAILIEDLKGRWKEHILNQDVNDNKNWEEDQLANYRYTWPSSRDAKLEEKWESARDLLTEEDFKEVLESVKATEPLKQQVDVLKAVEEEIKKEVKVRRSVAGSSIVQAKEEVQVRRSEAGSSSMQTSTPTSTSQHATPSATLTVSEGPSLPRGLSHVIREVHKVGLQLGQKVDGVSERVDDLSKGLSDVGIIVRDIQRDVRNVHNYQLEILDTMVRMNGQLDQLIGITASLVKSEVPSRPYLTRSDVTWTHRICAAVNVGTAMTLHFMCEKRSGNHMVDKQPGYPITVSKDNAEVLRFLCVNSVKILWYLLKAGVHVAAGLGNIIPDLEGGGATTLLTASAVGTVLMDLESGKYGQSKLVDGDHKFDQTSIDGEAWQYLKQLFSESLKGRCPEDFLLYRARYTTTPADSGHAWLCKECLEKGRQMNTLVVDE